MLHQGNKIIIGIFIFISFFGCNKYKEYSSKEINKIRNRLIIMSQSDIGESEYWNIYKEMNDSVHMWIENKLGWYKYYDVQRELIVDSVFCLNKTKNKLITAILKRCLDDCVQDNIEYFYGVKIRGLWYFFQGPNLTLPREFYQEDIHMPLSFEKLKQIATDHIYSGYLKRGKKGQWEINERFFDRIIPQDGSIEFYGLKNEEEYVKFMIELNWSSDIDATFKKYKERNED